MPSICLMLHISHMCSHHRRHIVEMSYNAMADDQSQAFSQCLATNTMIEQRAGMVSRHDMPKICLICQAKTN